MPKAQHWTFKHFAEIGARIKILLIIFLCAGLLGCFISDNIIYFLLKPVITAGQTLVSLSLHEVFFLKLKFIVIAAIFLTLPFALWQCYFFIMPGLKKKEKILFRTVIFMSPLLYFLGLLFSYYLVIPSAWKFFLSWSSDEGFAAYNAGAQIAVMLSLGQYLSFTISILNAFSAAFQLPVIIACLHFTGVIDTKLLRKYRRFIIVVMFIIAAILTPTDIYSQIFLALPLILMYELSIIICDKVNKS